jgi:hypothetical protein
MIDISTYLSVYIDRNTRMHTCTYMYVINRIADENFAFGRDVFKSVKTKDLVKWLQAGQNAVKRYSFYYIFLLCFNHCQAIKTTCTVISIYAAFRYKMHIKYRV